MCRSHPIAVKVDWGSKDDGAEFTVYIEQWHLIGMAPPRTIYVDGPFPDNGDDQTKDRLWKAVKTAVDIFEKIPGNICTTCNGNLAWSDTTTCPECSFAVVRGATRNHP